MSLTTMRQAFADAGYIDPAEIAWEAAIGTALLAWAKFGGDAAVSERHDHVRQFLSRDPTWAVLERCSPNALKFGIAYVLQEAARRIRSAALATTPPANMAPPSNAAPADAGQPAAGDQESDDIQAPPVPGTSSDAGRPAAPGQTSSVNHEARAGGAPSPDHPPAKPDDGRVQAASRSSTTEKPPAAPHARTAAALHVYAVLNPLDHVRVDGTPIGDCTVGVVRAWAERRQHDARQAGRDARFALALIANLPSSETLRDWWRDPVEVAAIYAGAEQEHGL